MTRREGVRQGGGGGGGDVAAVASRMLRVGAAWREMRMRKKRNQ